MISIPYTISIIHPVTGNTNMSIIHSYSNNYESLHETIIYNIAMDIYNYCIDLNLEIDSYDDFKNKYFHNLQTDISLDVYCIDYFYNKEWKSWPLNLNKDLIYQKYVEYKEEIANNNIHLVLLTNHTLFKSLINKNEPYIQEIKNDIQKEDLEAFKTIYQAFITDNTKYSYFSFDEEIPSSYYKRQFYKLCSCPEDCKSENYMYKVHRHHFIIPCNCQNGKRYCVLYKAYIHRLKQMGYEGAYFSYTIHDLLNEYQVDKTNEHLLKDAIIQYIQSDGEIDLHYKEWAKVE